MNTAPQAENGAPRRVVLVEDTPAHARLTRRLFQENQPDVEVLSFEDGETALACLLDPARGRPLPRLVLLDLKLPGLPGLEVLERIKLHPDLRAVPVVVLTSSAAAQDRAAAYRRFANGFVTKPVDFTQYVHMIQDLQRYWLEWNAVPEEAPVR